MKFKLHKNYVLSTLLGYSIAFTKNELTFVPPEAYKDAIGIGAIPETELEEDEVKAAPVMTGEERKEMIFAAFTTLVEKNEREAFTGNGSPHGKFVSAITGFSVDAKERDAMWAEFRQLHANPDA